MSFEGYGCIISSAAASLLTEFAPGKTVCEILSMERADIECLIGGPLSPARVKCGILALVALKEGLKNLQNQA